MRKNANTQLGNSASSYIKFSSELDNVIHTIEPNAGNAHLKPSAAIFLALSYSLDY